jgi:hypothetical protein
MEEAKSKKCYDQCIGTVKKLDMSSSKDKSLEMCVVVLKINVVITG